MKSNKTSRKTSPASAKGATRSRGSKPKPNLVEDECHADMDKPIVILPKSKLYHDILIMSECYTVRPKKNVWELHMQLVQAAAEMREEPPWQVLLPMPVEAARGWWNPGEEMWCLPEFRINAAGLLYCVQEMTNRVSAAYDGILERAEKTMQVPPGCHLPRQPRGTCIVFSARSRTPS